MIYFLTGENWHERDRALKVLISQGGEVPEYLDVEKLTTDSFKEILGAQTLFSQKRCIVVKHLSENKVVWDSLGTMLPDTPDDDLVLILVEDKPDKRTKTYKALQKSATVQEFPAWTERDSGLATEWLLHEAKRRGIPLKTRDASQVVQLTGADQGRLAAALEKLSLMQEITSESIEASIDAYAVDNVFILLETALRADVSQLQSMTVSLRQIEDAYRVFGLLSSQLMQLAALVYSEKSPNEVARDIGAAPFVLSKLAPFAARISKSDMRRLLMWAAETDMQMKSISIEPWVLVEQLLLKIASR